MSESENQSSSFESTAEVVTLGGGCFWCLEAVYLDLKGVGRVVSGYSGGTIPNPTYEQVSTGTTGHAEVVQITFDPEVISFEEILDVFFTIHDPTTLNRQGADVGPQYRSVIFYGSPEQRATVEQSMEELKEAGTWGRPIVTEVVPSTVFYPAEDYHQEYYRRNSGQPYCRAAIAPKLAKMRKLHFAKLK